ncbi:ABC transporter [Hamiltosporidium magnivora]|uniref:ABC transporter n=1 Tax=Hamiltosporidium magnivora TaxID=148818 RepID=A0A4Q9LAE2_9MICR|nr:ABC transporter [Hamiltosporidium magnivora]
MDIEWKNVDIELINKNKTKNTKYVKLVTNANGIVKAGSLCATMGPSGSGKTTLIKALVGRIPSGSKTSGEILASGQPRNYKCWSKTVGYVDQDDCIYEELDVKQTITFAAKFRLKDSSIDIDKKVENILEELDILDISGSKMNSISGGERKRVMIAIELVTEPKILFIDEPTSGLDSSTAYSFVNLMKKLSTTHKMSVIFTIHQPSGEIFNIFDQLILLSDSNQSEEYFTSYGLIKRESSTFPDFLAEVLKVKKKYREIPENQEQINKIIAEYNKKYPKSSKMQASNKNTISVGYLPNLLHIFILLHRRIKINISIKRIISTLVIFGFSFYLFYKIANPILETKNIDQALKVFLNIILKVVKDKKLEDFLNFLIKYGDEVSDVLKIPLFLNFIGIFFAYSLINSAGIFSQEYKQVKREL